MQGHPVGIQEGREPNTNAESTDRVSQFWSSARARSYLLSPGKRVAVIALTHLRFQVRIQYQQQVRANAHVVAELRRDIGIQFAHLRVGVNRAAGLEAPRAPR